MKRDTLLILNILSTIQQSPNEYCGTDNVVSSLREPPAGVERKGWDEPQVLAHINILKDAGFIEKVSAIESPVADLSAIGLRLTWQGHDYLEETEASTA